MEASSRALQERFEALCAHPSDINEHLPTLRRLAAECDSAAEFGVRGVVSTYALVQGLSFSQAAPVGARRSLLCVDIDWIDMAAVASLAADVGVDLEFRRCDSAKVEIPEVDLLWIDTWHIYEHLKRELAAHHTKARKFIAMHDTEVDGIVGESVRRDMDCERQAAESGYPIEGIRKGLKPAIEEFLAAHADEWEMLEHHQNCNGLTVLARSSYLRHVRGIIEQKAAEA